MTSGVAPTKVEAQYHFGHLQHLLSTLGLEEAKHKASPPSQCMIWQELQFDTLEMTVAIPSDKLKDPTW